MKALIQLVLSHVPFGVKLNHSLQYARGAYSMRTMLKLFLIQADHIRRLNSRFDLTDATVVEVGPGPFARGCLLFYLCGVKRVLAYDHLPHMSVKLIRRMVEIARAHEAECAAALGIGQQVIAKRLEKLGDLPSLDDALERLCIDYRSPGDAGDTGLPSQSVDLVFSYGVLEHIPESDLRRIVRESHRILRPTGRAYHNVGLHDHFHSAGLGNGVNFLRFSERFWTFLTGHKLGYHNRMRCPQFLELFDAAGFGAVWQETELTENNLEALRKLQIDPKFQRFSDVENATSHLYIELTPQPEYAKPEPATRNPDEGARVHAGNLG